MYDRYFVVDLVSVIMRKFTVIFTLVCFTLCFMSTTEIQAADFSGEMELAKQAMLSSKNGEAMSHLKNALVQARSSDDRYQAKTFAALIYMADGKSDSAIESLNELMNDKEIDESKKNVLRSTLAIAYSAVGQFDKAREQNRLVLADTSLSSATKADAQFLIAMSFFEEESYLKSASEFKKYLALPSLDLARISLGKLYLGEAYFYGKEYDSAAENFEDVIKVKIPDDVVGPTRRTILQIAQQANFMLGSVYLWRATIRYKQVLHSDFPIPSYATAAKDNLRNVESLLQRSAREMRQGGASLVAPPTSKETTFSAVEDAPNLVKVGQVAPDFFTVDASGKEFKLSDFHGKKSVLLTFFPKCFTGGCRNHLTSLQERKADFDNNDIEVIAISVDPADGEAGQVAFAKMWGFTFRFIPDTNRKVSMLYGSAQKTTDLSSRMSVVVDKSGIVQIVDTSVNVKTHGSDMLAEMKEMGLIK